MQLLKQHVGSAVLGVLAMTGTARWNRRTGATVLCYHNVVPDGLTVPGGDPFLHVRLSEFRQQIEWLRTVRTVIPLPELVERLRHGRSVGGLAAVTFDDGYAGVVQHAVPVMREAAVPFTVFPVVRAASAPRPFWWDTLGVLSAAHREHNVLALYGDNERILGEASVDVPLPDVMLPASWDLLREMLGPDCSIGVHGMTHRCLTAIPDDQVAWELTRARYCIGEQLGVHADIVAYPYGRTDARVREIACDSGFRAGMGTAFGLLRASADVYECARVNVPAGLSPTSFACWASGLRLPGG